MSRYRESILTDKGLDLARKAANGIIKITFTKGVLSADAHQNDNIQTVEGLTTLNAFVQSDPINYVTPSDDANVNVPLRFHNTNMTTDGYINTVGLYATDGTTEVLYSIIINDDPELFAAYNGTTPESVKINHTTQVGRADQVNVQVSPMGMVTEEEFNAKSFQYVDTWTKGIWDLQDPKYKDGMYYVPTNNIDNITDWNNQNSVVIKFSTPKGCVLQLIDSVGNVWVIDNFSGTFSSWNRLANASDVNAGLSAANSNAQSMANSVASTALSNQSSAVQNATNTWTSISNNANSIASNSNAISNISSSLSSASSSINNLSSITNQINVDTIKTVMPVDGLDFWNLAPGIYNFTGQKLIHTPYGDNAMLYGVCFSYGNQMIYYDKNGSLWRLSPQSGTWQSVANQTDITNVQSQINATNSVTLQYRGEWTEKGLWSIVGQLDGWYYVAHNGIDSIANWNNLNSQLFKTTIPSGCLLRLYDSWGHIWSTNNFNGNFITWKQIV